MTPDGTQAQLTRGITRPHLVGVLINTIVGAGILGLPSKAFALVGAWSLVTWLLCAVVVLGIALCLAEVSTRFRDSGGPYLYALTAFGPTVAFATGWLRLLTSVLAYATVCNLLIGYLSLVAPVVAGGTARIATITLLSAALTFVLVRGLKGTVWTSTMISAGKILLLTVFVAVAAFHFEPSRVHWAPIARPTEFAAASLLSIFALFGFELGSITSGEVADPERDHPFAIIASIGITTLLYLLVQLACIGTLDSLALSSRPVADAASTMVGAIGGIAVTSSAVVLLLGVLLGLLVGASRTLFAMGERGQMPSTVASVHPRWRTPLVAIVVVATASWLSTIASSFTTAITIAVGTRVLTYIVVCAALPALRRRQDVPAARFKLPAGELIAGASIIACTALLATAKSTDLLALAVLVAVGLALRGVLGVSAQAADGADSSRG